MNELTLIDKAWLAGFADGEGYFGIVRQLKKSGSWLYHPLVILTNTDKNVIDEVTIAIGIGKRAFKSPTRANKAGYQLKIGRNEDICALIDSIGPYLKVKKVQAQLLVEFCMLRKSKGITTGRGSLGKTSFGADEEKIYLSLRNLNARGT